MSSKPWKRKHRKSGNNQKISPEIKKQKTLTSFTCSDKATCSVKMAEKLNTNAEKKGKAKSDIQAPNSGMESKLDFIIERIKPIDDMSRDLKTLTEKLGTLEQKLGDQESKIGQVKASIEMTDNMVANIKTDVDRLCEESKSKQVEHEFSNLWKVRCNQLELSLRKQEEYSRRNNIIFEGVLESPNETCSELVYDILTERMLIQDARTRIQFTQVHRIGKKRSFAGAVANPSKARPIITRVINYSHKGRNNV